MTTPDALATMVTATPRNQWGTAQCVAWVDGADRRCTRTQAQGRLCTHHHTAAQRRWDRYVDQERERREKADTKRAEQLPGWIAERDQIRARINQLDPPTRADNAAYVGEVHTAIRKQQLARLSDTRVSELARLAERLDRLNQQIGDDDATDS